MKRGDLTQEEKEYRRRKSREYYHKNVEKRRAQDRARYQKNRDRVLARQTAHKAAYRATEEGRVGLILQYANRRATKRGLEFTLTREWVEEKLAEQQGRCAMSGLPFVYEGGTYHPQQPSLDRVQGSSGYTPENTRLVCWMWNSAKGSATDENVKQFCRAVVDFWS